MTNKTFAGTRGWAGAIRDEDEMVPITAIFKNRADAVSENPLLRVCEFMFDGFMWNEAP